MTALDGKSAKATATTTTIITTSKENRLTESADKTADFPLKSN